MHTGVASTMRDAYNKWTFLDRIMTYRSGHRDIPVNWRHDKWMPAPSVVTYATCNSADGAYIDRDYRVNGVLSDGASVGSSLLYGGRGYLLQSSLPTTASGTGWVGWSRNNSTNFVDANPNVYVHLPVGTTVTTVKLYTRVLARRSRGSLLSGTTDLEAPSTSRGQCPSTDKQ